MKNIYIEYKKNYLNKKGGSYEDSKIDDYKIITCEELYQDKSYRRFVKKLLQEHKYFKIQEDEYFKNHESKKKDSTCCTISGGNTDENHETKKKDSIDIYDSYRPIQNQMKINLIDLEDYEQDEIYDYLEIKNSDNSEKIQNLKKKLKNLIDLVNEDNTILSGLYHYDESPEYIQSKLYQFMRFLYLYDENKEFVAGIFIYADDQRLFMGGPRHNLFKFYSEKDILYKLLSYIFNIYNKYDELYTFQPPIGSVKMRQNSIFTKNDDDTIKQYKALCLYDKRPDRNPNDYDNSKYEYYLDTDEYLNEKHEELKNTTNYYDERSEIHWFKNVENVEKEIDDKYFKRYKFKSDLMIFNKNDNLVDNLKYYRHDLNYFYNELLNFSNKYDETKEELKKKLFKTKYETCKEELDTYKKLLQEFKHIFEEIYKQLANDDIYYNLPLPFFMGYHVDIKEKRTELSNVDIKKTISNQLKEEEEKKMN